MKKLINVVLTVFLCIFQVLDGIFTYIGVTRYGSIVEANPLVKHLIETYGAGTSLIVLKSIGTILLLSYLIIIMRKKTVVTKKDVTIVSGLFLVYLYAVVTWFFVLFILV